MRLYEPPAKEFFRLPNSIFHVPLDATQFKLYAYLVCCSGSKEYCWPTHKKIIQDTGIKKSSLQKAIKVLVKLKLIAMYKHRNPYGYGVLPCPGIRSRRASAVHWRGASRISWSCFPY